jgi:hypothetical protein
MAQVQPYAMRLHHDEIAGMSVNVLTGRHSGGPFYDACL